MSAPKPKAERPLRKGRGVTDAHTVVSTVRKRIGYLTGWTDNALRIFEQSLAMMLADVQSEQARRSS